AVLHRHPEIGQKNRQTALVLRNHAAFAVDEATAKIPHLVDHHVVGGLAQRRRHFVGISVDRVAHDLDGDRIYFHYWSSPSCSVMMMFPQRSISARSPGPISVVELGSSIKAGPAISLPAARCGRHRMRVSTARLGSSYTTSRRCSSPAPSGFQGADSQQPIASCMRGTVTTRRRLTTSID